MYNGHKVKSVHSISTIGIVWTPRGCGNDIIMIFDTVIGMKLSYDDVSIYLCLSFASCCVDEVAAEHFSADCIIHFGHACLSPTNRLPVLYVFGQSEIDIEDCVKKFSSLYSSEDNVVLMFDTGYSYVIGNFFYCWKIQNRMDHRYKENLVFLSSHVKTCKKKISI